VIKYVFEIVVHTIICHYMDVVHTYSRVQTIYVTSHFVKFKVDRSNFLLLTRDNVGKRKQLEPPGSLFACSVRRKKLHIILLSLWNRQITHHPSALFVE
jgi:hypothetical protein